MVLDVSNFISEKGLSLQLEKIAFPFHSVLLLYCEVYLYNNASFGMSCTSGAEIVAYLK